MGRENRVANRRYTDTYYKKSGSLGEYYDFSTKAVEAIGGECATGFSGDGGTPARMGTLLRMKTKDTAEASAPIPLNGGAPINGYYYYYSSPQSMCGGADLTSARQRPKPQLFRRSKRCSKRSRKRNLYDDNSGIIEKVNTFRLSSEYQPTGDQPTAIAQLRDGLERGSRRCSA